MAGEDDSTGLDASIKRLFRVLGVLIFTGAVYLLGTQTGGRAGDTLRYSAIVFGLVAGLIAIYGLDGIEKLL